MAKVAGEQCRCFFAVWPDAVAATALYELGRQAQADCGGRPMRRDTLHITLAFLGDIEAGRVADAKRVAETIVVSPFDLMLDRLGYWRHNRILWAGGVSSRLTFPKGTGRHEVAVPSNARDGAQPHTFLAEALGDGLRAAGFALDARPFVAHLTLLRDAHCTQVLPLPQPVVWPVREFVLAQSRLSRDGARYDIVGRWPLR
ncbi:MAG: RNA 2',3'-cyclic phosphodiesterase [Gammaproteobacteria bacterium]|nr:RNA 2',3'-cyclic phosphodiesterase [Gammaproteobacteria bacterium]MBU1414372.1 RNA 2',3'-cyclic phosphodiesterase [Gammaproteobacteria bacterium]